MILGESSSQSEAEATLYLICQGEIRLLSAFEQQPILSLQRLTIGDIFGGDRGFEDDALPYQAIAASDGLLAQVRLSELQPWLQASETLHSAYLTCIKERQKLIFFKTQTAFSSLSYRQLQTLLPYILELPITPGECLNETIDKQTGQFWLRRGQTTPQPLAIGSTWHSSDPLKLNYVAQRDLCVYYLPREHQAMLQGLVPNLGKPLDPPKKEVSTPHPTLVTLPVKPRSPSQLPAQRNNIIQFPQPANRRRWFGKGCPWVQQQSSSDCGAACLGMISLYWGKRFSLNRLRELAQVGRVGASLKNLAQAAEQLGFQSRPVRASLTRLVEQKNPWIAHWEGNHYLVVDRIRGKRVLVADPAKGKQWLSREAFLAGWTGFALLLEPTPRFYETPNDHPSLNRYLALLGTYRGLGLQIILVSILIQIFGLVTPLFTQVILDQVVVNKSQITLNVFIVGALLCGVWGIGLGAVQQYLLCYLSNRLDLTLISGFVRHVLLLPLKFFESRRVGDILTRVQENQKIQRFLIQQVLLAWLNFVTGFVYLGLMLYYNWRLTLLILALIPPITLLTLGATPFLRKLSRELFSAVSEQNSLLVETMTGIGTVKASASEQEVRWRWEERLVNQLNVQFRGQRLGIKLGTAGKLIHSFGSIALLWYGATLVIQNQLTVGQLVAFNMMVGRVLSPVLTLTELWDELQEVLISVERLNDVFETELEESDSQPRLSLPALRGDIRLSQVTFRYDAQEGRNVLQNISCTIAPGQTVAIVGRSGSGKSTLVKLLQGLYLPSSGEVWVDDYDTRQISPKSLREQIGVVPQDCFLFSGTIFENITLYRPDFSLEKVIEAAKLAEAHGFIQGMPLGYQTKVGERGTNLSGGQKQRIAIARALLGEPPILILDEATSSLDTESERRFQKNLTRFSRDRTTIMIAHRLSTVRNADSILVLDKGLLVEQGTHKELMAHRGLYFHLAQQQLDL